MPQLGQHPSFQNHRSPLLGEQTPVTWRPIAARQWLRAAAVAAQVEQTRAGSAAVCMAMVAGKAVPVPVPGEGPGAAPVRDEVGVLAPVTVPAFQLAP